MVPSSLGVELTLMDFDPIRMVGQTLVSLDSLENVDTSDLPTFREIFHSTLHFWTTSTAACAFCSGPRNGLILLPLGEGELLPESLHRQRTVLKGRHLASYQRGY